MGKVSGNGYSAIDKTSFGADTSDKSSFFTGKPYVEDLGYAFLFRNYRADMGKWQVRDLSGYPNGWNNLLYANNAPIYTYDRYGLFWDDVTGFAGAVTDSVTNNVVTQIIGRQYHLHIQIILMTLLGLMIRLNIVLGVQAMT